MVQLSKVPSFQAQLTKWYGEEIKRMVEGAEEFAEQDKAVRPCCSYHCRYVIVCEAAQSRCGAYILGSAVVCRRCPNVFQQSEYMICHGETARMMIYPQLAAHVLKSVSDDANACVCLLNNCCVALHRVLTQSGCDLVLVCLTLSSAVDKTIQPGSTSLKVTEMSCCR